MIVIHWCHHALYSLWSIHRYCYWSLSPTTIYYELYFNGIYKSVSVIGGLNFNWTESFCYCYYLFLSWSLISTLTESLLVSICLLINFRPVPRGTCTTRRRQGGWNASIPWALVSWPRTTSGSSPSTRRVGHVSGIRYSLIHRRRWKRRKRSRTQVDGGDHSMIKFTPRRNTTLFSGVTLGTHATHVIWGLRSGMYLSTGSSGCVMFSNPSSHLWAMHFALVTTGYIIIIIIIVVRGWIGRWCRDNLEHVW